MKVATVCTLVSPYEHLFRKETRYSDLWITKVSHINCLHNCSKVLQIKMSAILTHSALTNRQADNYRAKGTAHARATLHDELACFVELEIKDLIFRGNEFQQ